MLNRTSALVVLSFLVATAPVLADGGKSGVLLAAKGKKAEEEAKKVAEEAAAKQKAADEEAAKAKAAEEEAAKQKAADEEAAKAKAAEEEAAKAKAAETAKAETAASDDATGEEVRFDDLGFKDKYFAFSLPDTAGQQVQDEKIKYVVLTFLVNLVLPFSELWLPMLMWDPKPEFDMGRMLVPYIIKTAIWVGGHVALGLLWPLIYFPICNLLYVGAHVTWYGVNIWTSRMMMLQIWDDIIKHPPEKKKSALVAPRTENVNARPATVDELAN